MPNRAMAAKAARARREINEAGHRAAFVDYLAGLQGPSKDEMRSILVLAHECAPVTIVGARAVPERTTGGKRSRARPTCPGRLLNGLLECWVDDGPTLIQRKDKRAIMRRRHSRG